MYLGHDNPPRAPFLPPEKVYIYKRHHEMRGPGTKPSERKAWRGVSWWVHVGIPQKSFLNESIGITSCSKILKHDRIAVNMCRLPQNTETFVTFRPTGRSGSRALFKGLFARLDCFKKDASAPSNHLRVRLHIAWNWIRTDLDFPAWPDPNS